MPQESSNTVVSEIDEIIRQAMEEYNRARGIEQELDAELTSEEPPVLGDGILAQMERDYVYVGDLNATTTATTYSSSSLTDATNVAVPTAEPVHEEIPANSNSILVGETTSRFSDAIWYQNVQSKSIVLAGLGGIGSYVAFLLGRLRPRVIELYDDDIVEEVNLAGQLYSRTDCGNNKANAIQTMLFNYANYYSTCSREERFTRDSNPGNIMICGFDNMEARNTFYTRWKTHVDTLPQEERATCLFIDGRLAAENFQVLCITGDDEISKTRYERDFLFSDEEADETVCTYKQTTFMANMIGSIIVNLFLNFCANECNPLFPRDLPFLTEYSADTMYFKTVA